jgi:hypothetical protein
MPGRPWKSQRRSTVDKTVYKTWTTNGRRETNQAILSSSHLIRATAIAPTWTHIGQLASIAAIHTFFNYFLELDIERSHTADKDQAA